MVGAELAGLVLLSGALSLVVTGVTTVPAEAVPVAGTLTGTPSGAVVSGEDVRFTGTLAPAKARPIRLQSRLGTGVWRTVTKGSSKPSGRFSLTVEVRAQPGRSRDYRVLAPAATVGGRRLPARRTPTVHYQIVAPTGGLTAQPVVTEQGHLTATASFGPPRKGRPVTFEGWDGSTWVQLATDVQDAAGEVDIDVVAPAEGAWRLRAWTGTWHGVGPTYTPETVVHVQPALDAGAAHACQVASDGTGWCWGWNELGQLGDHSYVNRPEPQQLSGGGWARLAAGAYATCGLQGDGTLWCWGTNSEGELGDGTGQFSFDPVQVAGEWVAVDADSAHACGIRSDGTLWCWGRNTAGQLGDGSLETSWSPVRAGPDTDWVQVDTGWATTCGVRSDGSLWCWGANDTGALGDGTTSPRYSPVRVGTDNDWAQVTAAESWTCAVKTTGTLWCWGSNNNGTLGTGSFGGESHSPVQVGSATTWVHADGGSYQTCGARSDGTDWCWGLNTHGQLGTGVAGNSASPVQVVGSQWTGRVTSGGAFVCAIDDTAATWCWGANLYGAIGDGTLGSDHDRAVPTAVLWP
jgi:alpha-tubulin suppressor-like RCC1 family protein